MNINYIFKIKDILCILFCFFNLIKRKGILISTTMRLNRVIRKMGIGTIMYIAGFSLPAGAQTKPRLTDPEIASLP